MTFLQGGIYLYIVVLAVNVVCFLTGAALGWSSPIIAKLKSNDTSEIPFGRSITSDEESWIGSLSALGGIIGPCIFTYVSAVAGRKWANTLVVLPYLSAYLIAAFAKTVWLYYISRILMGMGVGGVFSISNVYVGEISESRNRGILISSIANFLMIGIFFSNVVGAYGSIMTFNLILSVVAIIYIPTFLYIAPESPFYLVRKKKDDEALKSLRYLRRKPSKDLNEELHQIKDYVKDLKPGTVLDIFRTKASTKALLYSVLLTNFQQFSGINVIYFFTVSIFRATGSNLPAEICSIIVTSVQVIASFIAPIFADTLGRRKLLLTTITGAVLSEILLGIYFFLQDGGDDVSGIGWLPILAVVTFLIFYNSGMGPLPWVIMCEILPTNVISPAAAVTTSFYWFTGFLLTRYFADLSDAITMAGSFWLFAGFGVTFWLFMCFIMFETKGKTFKEIQDILNS